MRRVDVALQIAVVITCFVSAALIADAQDAASPYATFIQSRCEDKVYCNNCFVGNFNNTCTVGKCDEAEVFIKTCIWNESAEKTSCKWNAKLQDFSCMNCVIWDCGVPDKNNKCDITPGEEGKCQCNAPVGGKKAPSPKTWRSCTETIPEGGKGS